MSTTATKRKRPGPLTDEQKERAAGSVRLAYWTARRAMARMKLRADLEGLCEEAAAFGLLKAAGTWHPGSGARWGYYATLVMYRNIIQELRRENTFGSRHRQVRPEALDRRASGGRDAGGQAEAAEAAAAVDRALARLAAFNPRAARVIRLRADGVGLKEIGTSLGVTKERVRQLGADGRAWMAAQRDVRAHG